MSVSAATVDRAAVVPPLRIGWRSGDGADALLAREWMLANGLGGYACGTIGGVPTRRYHSLLVAALEAPLGRTSMVNHVVEALRLPGGAVVPLTRIESPREGLPPLGALEEFRLENGRPVWRFRAADTVVEKRVVLTHQRNTVRIAYRLATASEPVTLVLEPLFDMRGHDERVDRDAAVNYRVEPTADGISVRGGDSRLPLLRLEARAGDRRADFRANRRDVELLYRVEQARGYECRGRLHGLGTFELRLGAGDEAVLTASTGRWQDVRALDFREALRLEDERRLRLLAAVDAPLRGGVGAELVLAADQFIVTPHARPGDEARLRAEGDEARTVIAGYPWFGDWGRDTMISLEGLTLLTGRHDEARDILQMFAYHVRDGLIPNFFPEAKTEGVYHTADATLWFFHALDRYEHHTGKHETRRFLLPKLVDIATKHFEGTRFGIAVDEDGLLRQGAAGYQLTWMDAKVGDWVVTPRRGKTVEINALFYNALRLLARWLADEEAGGYGAPRPLGLRAAEVEARAERLRESFNRRFWNPATGSLYDVVDVLDGAQAGRDDPSVRPNQLFAISLPHPVLDRARWPAVVRMVRDRLLTPFGLRSLAPGHPEYKPRYDGDLRSRDAAYHQGTVWSWLLGPFIDAWLKTFPDDGAGVAHVLDGVGRELGQGCIGTVSEIFDAEPPFTPRGCFAQAWGVAELLRGLVVATKAVGADGADPQKDPRRPA